MSDLLVWSSEYATGVEMIDGDHQTLFMMVNALHAAIENGDAAPQLPELFRRLSDYVDGHFAREERLMQAADYPGLAEHQAGHRDLTATLGRMLAEFEADPANFPVADLMDFLGNWLSAHVLKSDMDYVPYVKG